MTSDLLLKQGMEIQGYKDVLWGKNTQTKHKYSKHTPPLQENKQTTLS